MQEPSENQSNLRLSLKGIPTIGIAVDEITLLKISRGCGSVPPSCCGRNKMNGENCVLYHEVTEHSRL